MANRKILKKAFSHGSTLILAVVLTSMLAIIGTLFLLVSRVDRVSTSAIAENRELKFAVESVISKLSQQLVLDIPGIKRIPNTSPEEYYDYPDSNNIWLASIEPDACDNGTLQFDDDTYYWRQISDINGLLSKNYSLTFPLASSKAWKINYVQPRIVEDHEKISLEVLDPKGNLSPNPLLDPDRHAYILAADADGDGVSDSKWVQLDMSTSKGKPIFAAVRVVDNCGMLNVNTAYKFDPNATPLDISRGDGSSQMQVNLLKLSDRYNNHLPAQTVQAENMLLSMRRGADPCGIPGYLDKVVWRYDLLPQEGRYTPFDISDELKLRNRYILNYNLMTTRIEELWTNAYDFGIDTPVDNLADPCINWPLRTNYNPLNPLNYEKYDYRHISTTYNADQIVSNTVYDPNVDRFIYSSPMVDINKPVWTRAGVVDLYNALTSSADPNINPDLYTDPLTGLLFDKRLRDYQYAYLARQYGRLTANIVDFADADADITAFHPPGSLPTDDVNLYFGFEAQPFVSEIGMVISMYPETGQNYYAVELFNPTTQRIDLNDFTLDLIPYKDPCAVLYRIKFDPNRVDRWIEPNECYIIANRLGAFNFPPNCKRKEDPNLVFFGNWVPPDKTKPPVATANPRRNVPHYTAPDKTKPPIYIGWGSSRDLCLKRKVDTGRSGTYRYRDVYLDKQIINPDWAPAGSDRYFGRDARSWHIVYQLMEEDERFRQQKGRPNYLRGSLGRKNHIKPEQFDKYNIKFSLFIPNLYQDPANQGFVSVKQGFVTVGDVPRILTIGNSTDPNRTIGEQLIFARNESQIRPDLRNPFYRNIFQYLTVFDPRTDSIDNNGDGVGVGIDKNGDGTIDIIGVDPNEWAVPGRININTAPWYVIAQLPWMTEAKAQAIVAYRDKLKTPVNYSDPSPSIRMGRTNAVRGIINMPSLSMPQVGEPPLTGKTILREKPGFASIGELSFVVAPHVDPGNVFDYSYSIQEKGIDLQEKTRKYGSTLGTIYADLGREPSDNLYGFPDLTTDGQKLGDGIVDDFEEKDIIFSRISNLVTVRSDLFTAYILVRIGPDGPQKRAVAILDRSGVTSAGDKVKIVALHYVPDPR